MEIPTLYAISPLDGRYAEKLEPLRHTASEYGLMRFRVKVEIHWLIALANAEQISEISPLTSAQEAFLLSIFNDFNLDDAQKIKQLEQTTQHDVKAVEYFIQHKISAHQELAKLVPFIHFSCTSEDINNLAYALMLHEIRQHSLTPSLNFIAKTLAEKAGEYAETAMLSRTHGQSATPTTLGKELANVVARLSHQIRQLQNIELLGKFNGAVGNYNAHHAAYPEIDWPVFNTTFVESLGLSCNPYTTQIEPHDFIAEFLQIITRINTILLDFARDTWSYISIGYFQQKAAQHEVGSSTMPHKVNPIDFENAEGNFGIANALAHHLAEKLPISRWQRDLSDSTALRNLGSVFGYSLLAYQSLAKGLHKISANKAVIRQDLHAHWEVLGEAIQTVMRRYGTGDAYEQLKALTRDQTITADLLRNFVKNLPIPDRAKTSLLALTPESYTGFAAELAHKIKNNVPY